MQTFNIRIGSGQVVHVTQVGGESYTGCGKKTHLAQGGSSRTEEAVTCKSCAKGASGLV